MNLVYLINSVRVSHANVEVEFKGNKVMASLPVTEVELVDPTGQQGSILFKFRTDDERAYADATFKQGEAFSLSI